jgi:2-(1,2-epoxy-1,2-dihydrophenyl)acetyl-CoA isomerase
MVALEAESTYPSRASPRHNIRNHFTFSLRVVLLRLIELLTSITNLNAMYETLIYTVQDRVATITLNRQERYNAFDNKLSYELIDALKQINKDPKVRVGVLTGAGEKAFCSGQDLKDVEGAERSLGDSVGNRYNPITRLITLSDKPFIARVNGVAAGAGAGLVMACDYSIAADHASFVFAFSNLGLVPDSGTCWSLPRLVGRRKAFELLALGKRINSDELLTLGLVNEVVPNAELDTAIQRITQDFNDRAPKSIALIKRLMRESHSADLERMLELEMYSQEIAGRSGDYKEGALAFKEKRKPNFNGN